MMMNAKLIILNGKQSGQSFVLDDGSENLLGREEQCRIRIDDPACSRVHAAIGRSEDKWQITDRDSANGTFLNGTPIQTAGLQDGDKLLLGGTWFRFLTYDTFRSSAAGEAPPTWVLEGSIRPESSLTSMSLRMDDQIRRRELECLERVSTAIAQQTTPQILAEEVLQVLCESLRASCGRILWNQGKTVLGQCIRKSLAGIPDGILGQAVQTSEAVLVPLPGDPARTRAIFAPLKYLNRNEGLLWVAENPAEGSFTHEDLCVVASVSQLLGPPLKMLLDMQWMQNRQQELLASAIVHIVVRSSAMQRVMQMVARVADVEQTVLLRGESGVGKEVIARLIHETGPRRDQPMVCVNCAALTESLLESELFGHEKGAFTGATERRAGKFETADGGSIFLDELGNMSLATQAKLLRVLDGHPFERVGGHTPVTVNVRVLAATNADLEQMVRASQFREDLYHRLRVIEIRIPPLRERREDIIELSQHLLQKIAEQTGRPLALSSEAMEILRTSDWPGNIRQLRNTIERAAILCPELEIQPEHLGLTEGPSPLFDEVVPIEEATRLSIERALVENPHVPDAAQKLGMSRSALYRHMKKLGIKPPRERTP